METDLLVRKLQIFWKNQFYDNGCKPARPRVPKLLTENQYRLGFDRLHRNEI